MDALSVVRVFQAAWDARDLDAVLSVVTEDCVFESARPSAHGDRIAGRDALRTAWAPGFTTQAAPFVIEERFTAGDRVVQRWRAGDVRGVDVFRIRDGRVCEKLGYIKR